jgi:hypothetical protein
MKFRIIQERETYEPVRYIAEQKAWYWWSWRPLRNRYGRTIAFKTEEDAESYIRNVIRMTTPIYVKRTVVKEIKGENV